MANKSNNVLAVIVVMEAVLFCSGVMAQSFTFQGYPGAWSPSSVELSVVVPCHASVSVKLTAARYDHRDSDVPITIEYRAPDVPATSEPTDIDIFMVRSDTPRTETLTTPGKATGCRDPWRVKIVPYPASSREGSVVGNVVVSFVKTTSNIAVEDAASLANQKSVSKNIGPSTGFHQGWVEVSGTWNHSLFGFPGPMPVKLTFALLKPNGDVAVFDSGHSNHEINPCCSGDKLKLRFRILENVSGQWKLRITNDSGQDAMAIIPKATFTPSCQ